MKYAAEQYLATSGVPPTVVQPTAYLELWIDLLTRARRHGCRRPGRPRPNIPCASLTEVDRVRGRRLKQDGDG